MSQISENLTARREALGLTVPQVHQELNRRGFPVAFSTVAGWFNGSRGVRRLEHLKALCEVLHTDLDGLAGSQAKSAAGLLADAIARELEGLSQMQKEAILTLIRAMKSGN